MNFLLRSRIVLIISGLLLSGLSINSAQAASPKIGSSCPRVGISAIANGEVLTCTTVGNSSVWKVKARVKIGTKLAYQNILGDSCVTLNENAIYNGVQYACKSIQNRQQWVISQYILVDTRLLIQSIQDQLCAVPNATTLLNGVYYTCVQQGSSATWQLTPLATVNTKLASSALAGTKCATVGSITLLKGTYFKCGSNKKWSILGKQVLPKPPVQPTFPPSVCVNLSTIQVDIANANAMANQANVLYQKIAIVKQALSNMNPPASVNSPQMQNYLSLKRMLPISVKKWLDTYQKTLLAITKSRPSCQSTKSKLIKISSALALEVGVTLP